MGLINTESSDASKQLKNEAPELVSALVDEAISCMSIESLQEKNKTLVESIEEQARLSAVKSSEENFEAKTAEKVLTASAEATVKDRERILSILDCTVAGQEGIAKEAIISGISAGEFAIKMVQSIQETGKSALSRLASADKKASQVDSGHDLEDEVAMSPADKAKKDVAYLREQGILK